ncbi:MULTISPECIES: hypothetical protein [Bacillus]|uniref:hypothetical protein n=1 Tax=Bacillus TaxID=1386 RepID=UPI000DC2A671|nr:MULTISPECIES: hypothetical protein [Bacillus]MBJ7959161.1 hypothetical protein [Bacillus cereus group sp. N28]MDD9261724.1 hypothetical protein [Bacillus toyonensis]MDI6530622.1 hypothetical protein [Bacillus mycoides]RAN69265.1 hypothetical protein B5P40_18015 [Bacillus sp. SRB_8]WJE60486.1 hypothetical protein QRE64_10905 [Bacillus mycoides]
MIINHAGNLKKDYFLSYMKLIMNAHQCNVENAKDYIFKSMFGFKNNSLGKETYQSFIEAYQELKQSN